MPQKHSPRRILADTVDAAVEQFRRLREQGLAKFLSGNILQQLINFSVLYFLTRFWTEDTLGIYTVGLAVMTLATQVGDLGLNVSLVRFAQRTLAEGNQDNADPKMVSAAVVILKLTSGLVVYGGLFAAAPLIAAALGLGDLVTIFRIAVVGAMWQQLWEGSQAIHQTEERFHDFGAGLILSAQTRLLAMLALWWFERLTPTTLLIATATQGFVAIGVQLPILWKALSWRGGWRLLRSPWLGQLGIFTSWMALNNIITAGYARFDIMMLEATHGPAASAHVFTANRLALIFPLVMQMGESLLLPSVSRKATYGELRRYVRRLVASYVVLLPAAAVILVLAPFLVTVMFTQRYVEAVPLFQIMVVGHVLNLPAISMTYIFYTLGKTWVFTVQNTLQMAGYVAVLFWFIPEYGSIAAAWAHFAFTTVHLPFLAIVIWRMVFTKPTDALVETPTY